MSTVAGQLVLVPGLPGTPETRLSATDFQLFQQFIYNEAGIYLNDSKQALLVGRLSKRLRALGHRSFREYFNHVQNSEAEKVQMLDSICTNETHFFREKRHYKFIEEVLIPRWEADVESGLRQRSLRVWSAGCSTGEEPYSIAMLLLSSLRESARWSLEIVATDISTKVLERASRGLWPVSKQSEIPATLLKAYMLRGTGKFAGLMKASDSLREHIRFERVNLNEDRYPVSGVFDMVFCCNVLIYFDAASKRHVVSGLGNHLAKNGHLFLGHAESLSGITSEFTCMAPTIYRRGTGQAM